MNKKLKIVLIVAEVLMLVVLILVAVGCQKKWIIPTDDGPRFDWYAVEEDLGVVFPNINNTEKPEESDQNETSEIESTEQQGGNTYVPPATTAPQETEEPTTEPLETTDPSAPPATDNWETDEF